MKKITIRKNGSRSVAIDFSETVSKVDASYKKSCDINNIMKQYAKTGILPNSQRQGVYADVSSLPDLETSFKLVNQAVDAFNSLPADIRKLIDNDPSKLANFISDERNLDICLKYGLLEKKMIQTEKVESKQGEKHEQGGSTGTTI